MAEGRLFHYRFNPADCYAEIDEMSIEERGRFLTRMCRDLVKGESDNCFISNMIEEARKYIETKKLAGSKGGKARVSSAQAVLGSAQAVLGSAQAESSTPQASSSISSNTVTKAEQKKESKSSRFTPPDWIDLNCWNAFLEMRVKIKKPLTEKAMAIAVEKLAKLRSEGEDISAVLNQSTFNSWQGLFMVKENGLMVRGGQQARSPAQQRQDRTIQNAREFAVGDMT